MSDRRALRRPAGQPVVSCLSCPAIPGSLRRAPQTIGLTKTDRDDTPVCTAPSIGEAVRRAEHGTDDATCQNRITGWYAEALRG